MKHILDRFDTCWMWYHFCSLSHRNDYYGTIEPLWNVSSLWSNCYLAFLGCSFLQYNVFYSLSSCMNYAVYVKRLKICFHCILSEWDLLYQGFKKKRRRRPNWNVVVDLDTRQLGRHYIAMFESSQNVMLKPTESWRETLLDSRVMELFFTVSSIVLFC